MEQSVEAPFTIVDYIVLIATLLFSLLIGVYYAFIKKQKTNQDLLVGGRNMSVVPVAFSMMATYMSAIMILGTPAEVYEYGTLILTFTVETIVFVPISCFIYIPTFYRLKLTSVYEYLHLRFNSVLVRWLAAGTFILEMVLYMGMVLFAPSLAMGTFLHFPVWASILVLGGCATLYTAIGGLRAVVWTDVFQVIVMFTGMMVIFIKCTINVGGLTKAFEIADSHGRLQYWEPSFSPFVRHTTWGLFLGSGFFTLCMTATHQPQVQRYSSMGTLREAISAMLLTIPIGVFLFGLAIFTGVVIFANYAGCDPLKLGLIERIDQIVPLFVVQELTMFTGMMGLFLSCLFSAALSTLSSGLNSLAAVAWEDFFALSPRFNNMAEESKGTVTKFLAVGFGIISVGFAFMSTNLGSVLAASFAVTGAVIGPLGGIFIVGLFMPFVNKWGASIGMITGHVITIWISAGAHIMGVKHPPLPTYIGDCVDNAINATTVTALPIPSTTNFSVNATTGFDDNEWTTQLYKLSYILYPLLGALITIIVGFIVSFITGFSPLTPEMEHLIHPGIVQIYKWTGYKGDKRKSDDYKPVRLQILESKTETPTVVELS